MRKGATPRPRQIAPEWAGFAERLNFAVSTRRREDPGLTQNAIAEAAYVDSGNLVKILDGTKAQGVTANTVILLARALRVRPTWLLTGEEPSGLVPLRTAGSIAPDAPTPLPESELRRSSRP